MKKINLKNILLTAVGACGLFVSCEKPVVDDNGNGGNTDNEEPSLSLSVKELPAFSAFGDEATFEVTANMPGFTATVIAGDESWCHLTIDGNKVKVVVDKNDKQEMRSTTITVALKTEKKRLRVEQDAAPSPENMPKVFAPMSWDQFTESRVYKVMADGVQVAEMCREYVCGEGVDNQAVVVYPVKDGKADHSKGLVLSLLNQTMDGEVFTEAYTVADGSVHGGTVSFDADAVTAYTAGDKASADIKYICLDEKGVLNIVSEKTSNMVEATLEADTVKDADNNVYGVVKIASHYWLTSDLRTKKLADGTDIQLNTVFGEGWTASSVYIPSMFPEEGNLYSCQAAGWKDGSFTDRISPAGYTIPTEEVIVALNAYLGKTGIWDTSERNAGIKVRTTKDKGHWIGWEVSGDGLTEITFTKGSSNISGLGIIGHGYQFFDSETYEGHTSDAFYMTSTAVGTGLKTWHLSFGSVNVMYDCWGDARLGRMAAPIRCVKY